MDENLDIFFWLWLWLLIVSVIGLFLIAPGGTTAWRRPSNAGHPLRDRHLGHEGHDGSRNSGLGTVLKTRGQTGYRNDRNRRQEG